MCEALRQHPETAAWMREKGEVDGAREARRIFDKACHALPLIRVLAGKLHTITTEAEAAIIKAGVPLYQRGRDLVRPSSRQVPAAHGRTTLAAGLSSLNGPGAIDLFCQVAEWERFDKRSGDWVRTDPPRIAADILLPGTGNGRFPPSLVSSPRPPCGGMGPFSRPRATMQ